MYFRVPGSNYLLRYLHRPALMKLTEKLRFLLLPMPLNFSCCGRLAITFSCCCLIFLIVMDEVGPNDQSDFGLIIIAEKMTPISASNIWVILSRSHCLGVG